MRFDGGPARDGPSTQPARRPQAPLPLTKVPWWKSTGFKIGAPIAAAVLLIGGIAGAVGGGNDEKTPSAASPKTSVAAAITPAAVASTTAPSTTKPPAPTTAAATSQAAAPAPTSVAAPKVSGWPLPNEVGKSLQHAQDDLQRVSGNPIYFSYSKDLLGSRSQVLDSKWQVCNQNVPVGSTFTDTSHVTFGVVKYGERCP